MYRGVNAGNSGNALKGNLFAFGVLLFSFIMLSTQTGISSTGFLYNILHGFFIGAAFGVGVNARIKPSFTSVAPFSPKQRIVYSYLSTILVAIIACVFWTVITMAFAGIIGLIAFLASGENIFIASEDIIKKSAYYNGYDVLFGLYMWLSVYALSFIPRTKYRNIAFAVWFAVNEALALVLVNVCYQAYAAQAGMEAYRGFMFAAPIYEQMDYLAHPWVLLLIMGILAAAAFAASLVMSIRYFRTTKI